MKKFFESPYFNALFAVLAAVLIILQEVCLGTPLLFINLFAISACAGFGFSWIVEGIKFLFHDKFIVKEAVLGSIAGIVAALITTLLIVL